MPETDDKTAERIGEIADQLLGLEGPLLPILHALQAEFGCIPNASYEVLADKLNIGRAEVHGVVSFYHDLRDAPAGRNTLKICKAEACQSMGADELVAGVEAALGVKMGETSQDGSVTLEPVYCLGLCSCAPAAMLDDSVIARADTDGLVGLVKGESA